VRKFCRVFLGLLCLLLLWGSSPASGQEELQGPAELAASTAKVTDQDATQRPGTQGAAAPAQPVPPRSGAGAQRPGTASPPNPARPQPGTVQPSPPAAVRPTSPTPPPAPATAPDISGALARELSLPTLPAVQPSAVPLGGFGSSEAFSAGGIPMMIGDQAPILAIHSLRTLQVPPTPPPLPSPGKASSFVASVRGLKIAENQSPAPQDRVFYSFNYFAEVNQHVNQKFSASVDGLRVYREVMGFEKTFHDGDGSFGMRLPIDTVSANSTSNGNFAKLAGTSTAVDDLSFFVKYVFLRDPESGSLMTGGLAISTPNGPSSFAGAKYLAALNSTSIQPFVGYIWRRDRFYLHGFTAIDTPASLTQATMVYNDAGIGYFVYRNTDPQDWLTGVAPTFEVHVNTPLTHGDWTNRNDPGGVPNVVNLTYGINFEFSRRSILTLAMVTPVTGPRPFDYEALVLLNVFFGRTRRLGQGNPPLINQ
jgi:hypothetical protein